MSLSLPSTRPLTPGSEPRATTRIPQGAAFKCGLHPMYPSHGIQQPEVPLNQPLAFDVALDAAEQLDAEAQAELVCEAQP